MADTKISADPSASALAGTETLPLLQGGANKKVLLSVIATYINSLVSVAFSSLTGKPTTLSGYGITDAQPLDTQLTSLAGLSYSGNSLKVVRVNSGETGFEVATPASASRLSVTEDFYRVIAEANMTMTHGASGVLFDKVVDKGGLVILALGGTTRGLTWRTGTSYVVPTGKIAVIVDAKFSGNVMDNWTFYKHRLFNVTATTCNVAASSNSSGLGNVVSGWSNFTATWPSPEASINSDIPFPFSVAVAGESIRAELAGGSDANDRPVFGMYVLAIIDATTHAMGALS